ncbi:MAG: xanthine dehydrogenase family protein molybdopterin-binding subunit [Candidatus Binatia bacterium]|jgi:carbon-monoxide dehydrogenase large subunit|nr:xanthine dehydrogenase family protein molybdopterin-binding subunit [Candidatus Binatia bacterium]
MAQSYIGTSVRRREDVRFLTGSATFIDDVKLPHMLHAAILRSPHAHARILSIDAAKAESLPGMVKVFTSRDLAGMNEPVPMRMYKLPGLEHYLQHILACDTVRYVGDPIAVAVAENRYLAEDALDAIEVSYEIKPAVVELREALRNEVLVHEESGTNLGAVHEVNIGDAAKAFEEAEYTRREEFKIHRFTGNPLETRGFVAQFDIGKKDLTVWGVTKLPHYNRQVVAAYLKLPEHNVHFIENDVGAGFGIRGELYPEDFLIPFAAMKLGRPIKWIEDRREHLMAANHSREVHCELEIAARRDGTILALRSKVYGDSGAYVRTHGGIVPCSTAALLPGPYRIPNFQCTVHCVMTNKTGMGTLRAPGRYESCFFRERLLDMMAGDLKIDPVELRLKNMLRPEELPYEVGVTRPGNNPTILDSGDYPSALRRALKEFDYDNLKSLQGCFENGKYHGIGLACFVKNTGGFEPYEGARVVIGEQGNVAVYLSLSTLGQSHETTMAQICADTLGVPIDRISVIHGNTDLTPFGWGTFASRGTVMGGNALYLAAGQLKEKILAFAGNHLKVKPADLEFRDGMVYRKGTESPLLSLGEIVSLARHSGMADLGKPELDHTAYFNSNKLTHSYGAHLAHLTVDPETGFVEILKYLVVEDIGRCINPLIVHGQTVGAAVQGLGGTFLEQLVYGENGQLMTTTLMDYLLPTSTDVPSIDSVILEEVPSPLNPLGVKGAGEGGIVGTGAAPANALSNALASLGVEIRELPLTPDHIRKWIRERQTK